ncbi:glycoside hydrolase family 5 protein [Paramagnetospirillum kuznetsovii]|nr:cellulase family glycosylhydrolase [Paramagnetospirillum kuznetsovii]
MGIGYSVIGVMAALCLWAAPAAAQQGFIHAQGRVLADESGNEFAIRGIGLGNWLMTEGYMFKFKKAKAPRQISALVETLVGHDDAERFWELFRDRYVGRNDIRLIKQSGLNTVRVPLHYGLFLGQNDPLGADSLRPTSFEGPGWALLDRLIGWCREDGLKVLIDLHAAPGGQTGINHDDSTGFPLVFYVPRERRRTEELWREIARRYRDDPTVLGYELLNEPISTYNDEDVLNPHLETYYRELTEAVRAVDPNHLIFLASPQWGQNMGVFGPPFTRDLVYVFHEFWSTTERDAIQDYINFSLLHRVPILLGEAGEFNNQWNRAFRALNERFGFGWSFWSYKNLDSPTAMVSVTSPPGWDKIAKAGSMPDPSLAKAGLSRQEAKAILWAYLDALALGNAKVDDCYVRSLADSEASFAAHCPPAKP